MHSLINNVDLTFEGSYIIMQPIDVINMWGIQIIFALIFKDCDYELTR